jgi:N-acetylmuramoyl-L-alanine amidase
MCIELNGSTYPVSLKGSRTTTYQYYSVLLAKNEYIKIMINNSSCSTVACGLSIKNLRIEPITRYGDYDLASKESRNRKYEDITKRINLIDNSNCLLFISIHCNIYTNNTIKGAQTFFNDKNILNKNLSESIQEKMIAILKNTKRVAKSIKGKYLIDNIKSVGSLVEVGFLSNDEEASLLANPVYQDTVAYSIYLGIIDYLAPNNNL